MRSSTTVNDSNIGTLLAEYDAGIRDAIAAGTLVKYLKAHYDNMRPLLQFRVTNETHEAVRRPRFLWKLLEQVLLKTMTKERLNTEWAAAQMIALAQWDAVEETREEEPREDHRPEVDAALDKHPRKMTRQVAATTANAAALGDDEGATHAMPKTSRELAAGELKKRPNSTRPHQEVQAASLPVPSGKGKSRALGEQPHAGPGVPQKAKVPTQGANTFSKASKGPKQKPSKSAGAPQPDPQLVESSIWVIHPRPEPPTQPTMLPAPAPAAGPAQREQQSRIPTKEMSRMSVNDFDARHIQPKRSQLPTFAEMDVDDEMERTSGSENGIKQPADGRHAPQKCKREQDDTEGSGGSTSEEEERSDEDPPKVKPPPPKRGARPNELNTSGDQQSADKSPRPKRSKTASKREAKPTGHQFANPCNKCVRTGRICMESFGSKKCCECVKQNVRCMWSDRARQRKGLAPKMQLKMQVQPEEEDAPVASTSKVRTKGKGRAAPVSEEASEEPAVEAASKIQVKGSMPGSLRGPAQGAEDTNDEIVALRNAMEVMNKQMQSMANQHNRAVKQYEHRIEEMQEVYSAGLHAMQNLLNDLTDSFNTYKALQWQKLFAMGRATSRDIERINEVHDKIGRHFPGIMEDIALPGVSEIKNLLPQLANETEEIGGEKVPARQSDEGNAGPRAEGIADGALAMAKPGSHGHASEGEVEAASIDTRRHAEPAQAASATPAQMLAPANVTSATLAPSQESHMPMPNIQPTPTA